MYLSDAFYVAVAVVRCWSRFLPVLHVIALQIAQGVVVVGGGWWWAFVVVVAAGHVVGCCWGVCSEGSGVAGYVFLFFLLMSLPRVIVFPATSILFEDSPCSD